MEKRSADYERWPYGHSPTVLREMALSIEVRDLSGPQEAAEAAVIEEQMIQQLQGRLRALDAAGPINPYADNVRVD